MIVSHIGLLESPHDPVALKQLSGALYSFRAPR